MLPAQSALQLFLAQVFGQDRPGNLTDREIMDWESRADRLTEYWDWFTGAALDERNTAQPKNKQGEHPLKYPLQINPFGQACRLHNYALWGETDNTVNPLVQLTIEPKDESGKEAAKFAQDTLLQVEFENNTRAQDLDMGLISQALGGVVQRVAWEPGNLMRPTGIRYDYFDPRYFHARWRGSDFWNLEAAWVSMPISKEMAKLYGVTLTDNTGLYSEYWSRDEYEITIDGKQAVDENEQPLAGANEDGFVPFIYIPHERAGDFWGLSLIAGVIGEVQELNAREADLGDYIRFGVDRILTGANIKNGYPVRKTLSNGVSWYELGRATGQNDQPLMKQVDAPQLPQGAMDFTNRLWENVRIALFTPNIAYGKDEGSQRSGQTLYSRMWPFMAHVRGERLNWTVAKNLRAEMTLRMLARRGVAGVNDAHLGLRKSQEWAPMVPVDRAQLVDELIRRRQENAVSTDLMVTRFGDAPDVAEEISRIEEQEERANKMTAQKAVNSDPRLQEPPTSEKEDEA